MILLFVLVVGLATSLTNAQFDPICYIKGPAATFFKIDSNSKQIITDGSILNANKTTYFIIHGWTGSSTEEYYKDIAKKLSASGNAIIIDYYELGQKFYVTCAYYMVNTLGNFVGKLIKEQADAGSMDPFRIHIIGSSLGAQIAGGIGRKVKKLTGKKIMRISGLDPTGVLFIVGIVRIPWLSLGPSDAEMVDVLHTSIVFGGWARMGTVDFYDLNSFGVPSMQPGCSHYLSIYCSHQISKAYFLEAINSCGFVGTSISFLRN